MTHTQENILTPPCSGHSSDPKHETLCFFPISPAWVSHTLVDHLHEGHVLGQPLPDILHPLPGDTQGTEIRHQPPHALLHHEGGQHVLGVAQQQVEGDVQLRALLQRDEKG